MTSGAPRAVTEPPEADVLRYLLQVQQGIGAALADFPPADEWLEDLLELIGAGLRFKYGAVWRPASERTMLERDLTWTEDGVMRKVPGRAVATVRPGEGTVGRAWKRGGVAFGDAPLPSPPTPVPGLRSGVAFALRRGEAEEGVMEFATTRALRAGEELTTMLEWSGMLIGQSLDRLRRHHMLVRRDRALQSAGNVLVVCDARRPHHPLVFANAAFERLTGYSYAEAEGRGCSFLQGPGSDPDAVAEMRNALAEERETKVTLLNYRKDGSEFWNAVQLSPVRDDGGRVVEWVGVMDDVTERVLSEREFSRLAYTDPLTGLANRAMLARYLGLALARARRHAHSIALFLIDVDDFKRVNDSFGHAAGDDVLREIADRLRRATRESDLVARQGGDEFLLLVTDLEGDVEPVITALADKLDKALARPYRVAGDALSLDPSIGVSVFPTHGDDAATLLARADSAMYEVKRRRRAAAAAEGPSEASR